MPIPNPVDSRPLAEKTAEKRELGQFFTPPPVAEFLASFFTRELTDWRVIDPGAGAGALTEALLQRALKQVPKPSSFHVTAYEIDPKAITQLRETLARCAEESARKRVVFTSEVLAVDFIEHTTAALEQGFFAPPLRTFNVAITNPPYRKLRAGSVSHERLRAAGIEVTNLYSGFLALLSRLLEADSEMVAIVPRSFCNGPYFRAFRRDFLDRMQLQRLHVFGSRTAAFANESVLQENIIFRAQRTSRPSTSVEISTSQGDFRDMVSSQLLPYTDVVEPHDEEQFIRLPSNAGEHDARELLSAIKGTLSEVGIGVSTGKVVDFRSREFLRSVWTEECHPLIYPCHFEDGRLRWPNPAGKKAVALAVDGSRKDLLVPRGNYVVVRRFSSKEERRRIVASLIEETRLPRAVQWLGIENHLNFFHDNGAGLSLPLTTGLAAYLNWGVVDSFFRHFNGHTQVNVTDLRSLPFPPREALERLGGILIQRKAGVNADDLVAAHCLSHGITKN